MLMTLQATLALVFRLGKIRAGRPSALLYRNIANHSRNRLMGGASHR